MIERHHSLVVLYTIHLQVGAFVSSFSNVMDPVQRQSLQDTYFMQLRKNITDPLPGAINL